MSSGISSNWPLVLPGDVSHAGRRRPRVVTRRRCRPAGWKDYGILHAGSTPRPADGVPRGGIGTRWAYFDPCGAALHGTPDQEGESRRSTQARALRPCGRRPARPACRSRSTLSVPALTAWRIGASAMGVSLKDCYDSRPIDFTWSTLRDYPGPIAICRGPFRSPSAPAGRSIGSNPCHAATEIPCVSTTWEQRHFRFRNNSPLLTATARAGKDHLSRLQTSDTLRASPTGISSCDTGARCRQRV